MLQISRASRASRHRSASLICAAGGFFLSFFLACFLSSALRLSSSLSAERFVELADPSSFGHSGHLVMSLWRVVALWRVVSCRGITSGYEVVYSHNIFVEGNLFLCRSSPRATRAPLLLLLLLSCCTRLNKRLCRECVFWKAMIVTLKYFGCIGYMLNNVCSQTEIYDIETKSIKRALLCHQNVRFVLQVSDF